MSNKNIKLKDGDNYLFPQTKLNNISGNPTFNTVDAGLVYLTTAPTEANTNGIKFVVLDEEPETRYDGYLYMITKPFTITSTLTNCSGTIPTEIISGGSITCTITANSGCNLPDSITVTNATYNWDKSTGILTISNPTNNVNIIINAILWDTYPVDSTTGTSLGYTVTDVEVA